MNIIKVGQIYLDLDIRSYNDRQIRIDQISTDGLSVRISARYGISPFESRKRTIKIARLQNLRFFKFITTEV